MLVWFRYKVAMPMMLGEAGLLPNHFQDDEDQVDADDGLLEREGGRHHEVDEEQADADERDHHEGEHLRERLFDISIVAGVEAY